jgi:7-cyano-7-deazaguanine synthase
VKPSKSIILLSGGMDSLAILAMAFDQGHEVMPVFFNYGQKTLKKELQCFHSICKHYDLKNKKILNLTEIAGSALTDLDISTDSKDQTANEIPRTYVPFRNSIFLSFCVSMAEQLGFTKILIGAVQEDYTGYPDCRKEYFDSYNQMIKLGTSGKDSIEVQTPIIHYTKKDIVKTCLELNAPLELTWSCYANDQTPCGVCDSCHIRGLGFAELNAIDPLLK